MVPCMLQEQHWKRGWPDPLHCTALHYTAELAWGIPVTGASKVQALIWLVSTWVLLLCQSLHAGLGGSWCCYETFIAIGRGAQWCWAVPIPQSQDCNACPRPVWWQCPRRHSQHCQDFPDLVLASPSLGLCSPAVASPLLSHSHAILGPNLPFQPELASHPAQWLLLQGQQW